MKYTERVIIVVPAHEKDQANGTIKGDVDKTGGEHTFTCGLSPTGAPPATHYWCSTAATDSTAMKLAQQFGGKIFTGKSLDPELVLRAMGLARVQIPDQILDSIRQPKDSK